MYMYMYDRNFNNIFIIQPVYLIVLLYLFDYIYRKSMGDQSSASTQLPISRFYKKVLEDETSSSSQLPVSFYRNSLVEQPSSSLVANISEGGDGPLVCKAVMRSSK